MKSPPPLEGTKAIQAYWREPSETRLAAVLSLLSTDEALRGESEVARRHQAALRQAAARGQAKQPVSDLILLATQVQAPTLLVWGRADRFSPIDYGLGLLARITDAQFHMLPNCGHWTQRERPDEFNTLTLDFLGAAP